MNQDRNFVEDPGVRIVDIDFQRRVMPIFSEPDPTRTFYVMSAGDQPTLNGLVLTSKRWTHRGPGKYHTGPGPKDGDQKPINSKKAKERRRKDKRNAKKARR